MDQKYLAAISAILKKEPNLLLAYLFGSRVADERVRHNSDVDLALLWEPHLSSQEQWRQETDIYRQLIQILPPGIEADLVCLNRCDDILRHEVIAQGRCLYARDNAIRIEQEAQWFENYADAEDLREQSWKELAIRHFGSA